MSVRLITGDDAVLVSENVEKVVSGLLGGEDRSLVLSQLQESDFLNADGGWSTAGLVQAARTPPLLSARRVVVGRHLARFSRAADCVELVSLLDELPETTDLVLVWERGVEPPMTGRFPTVPKSLRAAVEKAGGEVLSSDPPSRNADARRWLNDRLSESSLRFDRNAKAAVEDLVGADRGHVVGLLRTLEGALGEGAGVTAHDVALYGGEAGTVLPWDLDDAIDRGDIAAALKALHRLLPSRHPLQLLQAMHSRYQRMLRLDGARVADERQAAELLGIKGSTFPARKALGQSRKLGSKKLARAITLLADADLALRGTIDWPGELVLEVLVARLAALSSR